MPTHIIVVAGTKGGCGKTTTATNLLTAARLAGLDAVGIDLDPQGSFRAWSQDRGRLGQEPAVAVLKGRLVGWRDIVATVTARLAVLDLAPGLEGRREATALQELAGAARLVLVPTLPEGELWSMLVCGVQAATCSSAACTGSPSRKRTPWITWASRCEPSNRRQLRSAALASL